MIINEFKDGDRVEVTGGRYKGCHGTIEGQWLTSLGVMIEYHRLPLHLTNIAPDLLRLLDLPAK